MKKLLLILALIIPLIGLSQKLHKTKGINSMPLTLNPTIFDPDLDSTITFIEFVQDSVYNIYKLDPEAKYSSISKDENFEQIFAIGRIRDYRVSRKFVSVIIKTHHTTGEIKTFRYTQKINKLNYYSEYKWATYGVNGYYFWEYDMREIKFEADSKCSL
jgi:hypothetical protein